MLAGSPELRQGRISLDLDQQVPIFKLIINTPITVQQSRPCKSNVPNVHAYFRMIAFTHLFSQFPTQKCSHQSTPTAVEAVSSSKVLRSAVEQRLLALFYLALLGTIFATIPSCALEGVLFLMVTAWPSLAQ
jgi:hypothetical protein